MFHLNSSDDDKYLSMPTSPELGDIKLVIYEVAIIGRSTQPTRIPSLPESDKVHERSKKAIGHRVRFVRCLHNRQ